MPDILKDEGFESNGAFGFSKDDKEPQRSDFVALKAVSRRIYPNGRFCEQALQEYLAELGVVGNAIKQLETMMMKSESEKTRLHAIKLLLDLSRATTSPQMNIQFNAGAGAGADTLKIIRESR